MVLGVLLVGAWVVGHAAFAGTTLRGKAAIAGLLLAAMFLLFALSRLRSSDGPWIFGAPRKACVDGGFVWLHYPNRRAELFAHPERYCWPSGGRKVGEAVGGGGGGYVPATLAVVGAFLALVAVAVAVAAIVGRRGRRPRAAPVDAEDPVVRALEESLDDLRRERDVRRAIVACYARMEAALARAGRGRHEHETPLEFLRRVLERVAREPGQVLTELFERARFSVEPMGEPEKWSAIAALEQLRAELAG